MYVWLGVSVRRRPTNSQHAIATTCAGQPYRPCTSTTDGSTQYYNRIHVREGEGRAEGQI